jgi:hypothetical protein
MIGQPWERMPCLQVSCADKHVFLVSTRPGSCSSLLWAVLDGGETTLTVLTHADFGMLGMGPTPKGKGATYA